MFEKVNPKHPDKVADRIAGALVDLAYTIEKDPKIAVEVLIGHGSCYIISETSVHLEEKQVDEIVKRIAGPCLIFYQEVPQDKHLSDNQSSGFRCGDNGIFKGVPITDEQIELTIIAHTLYNEFDSDGKYILSGNDLTICQSCAEEQEISNLFDGNFDLTINPLGPWTGGIDVDSGATNRKLGSDMGDSITGGGLHGKDFSKADVSINIYAWLLAQKRGKEVNICCSIGDDIIFNGEEFVRYSFIVDVAKWYIKRIGGFEKFAEWGLIRQL